jgi:hypothetical protein
MAAQEYIKKAQNVLIRLANPAREVVVTPEESKNSSEQLKNELKTEGKKITFNQLVELHAQFHIPRDTLRKKCERITEDVRTGTKKLPCAVYPDNKKFRFAVIEIPDNPKKKTMGMLFQEIVDS